MAVKAGLENVITFHTARRNTAGCHRLERNHIYFNSSALAKGPTWKHEDKAVMRMSIEERICKMHLTFDFNFVTFKIPGFITALMYCDQCRVKILHLDNMYTNWQPLTFKI